MAAQSSDRLRAALERLDQAIDRLDARAAAVAGGGAQTDNFDRSSLAERLDKAIARIERALVE